MPSEKKQQSISIEPIPPGPPTENQYIGFKLNAEWMDGYIRVRFPENLTSSMGWHFLDNLQPEIKRVSDVKVPVWQVDENANRISYSVQTNECIDFQGHVQVVGNTVEMQIVVANNTSKAQDISAQVCLDMSTSSDFNERFVENETFAVSNGRSVSFDKLTGAKAKEKFSKIGYNWILMLYGDGPHDSLYALEKDCAWWIADQKADLPLIWRQSRNGKHLVAMSWGTENVHRLMTNTSIPCLHSDPLEFRQLPAGKKAIWNGVIYLMENDTGKLMSKFK